jgi:hypothetical protein
MHIYVYVGTPTYHVLPVTQPFLLTALSLPPSLSTLQAKVLTEGGDLHEAQVDVPLSVSHSCV